MGLQLQKQQRDVNQQNENDHDQQSQFLNKDNSNRASPRDRRKTLTPSKTSDKTLLIGSSILHGINPKGLKHGVHKHSKSGATIQSTKDDITMYDLKNFQRVIIYTGGNDASRKTDIELFEERYCQLVEFIRKQHPACKVDMCTVCPREDVDVTDYNKIIAEIAETYSLKCVDIYTAFTDN